ncbi:uncharacterized protein N7469_008653 [Penicillium citrinum]|uniref:Uncharacterized protein n=1 Tax=Penicillium citrinum TaxID=5077 RepID=A0A9W9NPE6_PENCI|nr:uncharacterized protein N7469_008653 [Penicillium citrinum]KAJ5222413.1 hypothetical protein N7469_008653 [Penicillium citrinum]
MPQGYALRNKGGCPAPADSGGSTWNDFYTCCPPDTYNKPNQYNTICRRGVDQPTLTQCANTTWDLYAWHNPDDDEFEYFCCLQGLQGIYSKEKNTYGFFGCLNETDVDDTSMGKLDIEVEGKENTTTTSTASSATTPTSSSIATSASLSTETSAVSTILSSETSGPTHPVGAGVSSVADSSKSSTGAIVGGVVGGVCGLFLIGILIWFLARRQSKVDKEKQPMAEVAEQPQSGNNASAVSSTPRELGSSDPSELSGDTIPNRGENFGFYELEAKREGNNS